MTGPDSHETSDAPPRRRGVEQPILQPPQKQGFWGRLRSSFLAGIVVAAPIGITFALIYWFVTGPMAKLDAFVKRTLPAKGSNFETLLQVLPGVGVLIAVIAIVILGAVAKNFIGRAFIRAGEQLLDSVPVVRTLHRFFKNVFETALQQTDRSFKEVALIEYPRRGAFAMAFVVGAAKGEVSEKLSDVGEHLTALFVPTVPNPTSGFLLFLPREELRILDMSVEDAAKVVFSMGLVVPEFADPEAIEEALEQSIETSRDQRGLRKFFGRA